MLRYVSIDIETLGLDPDYCDVIEFAAIIDDFQSSLEMLPRFHCYVVKDDNRYCGEPYAMAMNKEILSKIATRQEGLVYIDRWELDEYVHRWLVEHNMPDTVVAAGKNFSGFDMLFLRRLGFDKLTKIHRRVLDPGSMFFDPKVDEVLPSLDECLKRCGFESSVHHRATDDALDVIRCIRYKYRPVMIMPCAEYSCKPNMHQDGFYRGLAASDGFYRIFEELQDERATFVDMFTDFVAAKTYVEGRIKGPLGTCSMFYIDGPDGRWVWSGKWVKMEIYRKGQCCGQ